MWVLALDTSSAAVQSAVFRLDGEGLTVRGESRVVNARAHGEALAVGIDAGLTQAGIGPSELDAVVAGLGPGPYTGLRVGLVTAAVMSDVLGIPSYGVCSLDGIGPAVGDVLVATDARRREVYWARYVDGERVAGPDVSRPADLDLSDAAVMVGAGAHLYAEVFGLPLLDDDFPALTRLVERARPRLLAGAPTETLTPLYLRRPDAVEPGPAKAVRT
jgi:tRNA threonylcarbamoyl adenosine modification protein YeaZ